MQAQPRARSTRKSINRTDGVTMTQINLINFSPSNPVSTTNTLWRQVNTGSLDPGHSVYAGLRPISFTRNSLFNSTAVVKEVVAAVRMPVGVRSFARGVESMRVTRKLQVENQGEWQSIFCGLFHQRKTPIYRFSVRGGPRLSDGADAHLSHRRRPERQAGN